jgi:two-component system phosphate regulon sensor histidine kinase PhoR
MLLLGAGVEGRAPIEVIRHAELIDLLNDAAQNDEPASGEIEVGGLKPRRLLVHVVPISGEAGGLLAVFVDVTHLRKLETMRRDFVANASHELRTPVAAIQSAAETLEGAARQDPEAAAGFIRIIGRNAERLRNLIDDLLDLSKIESQDFRVNPEPIELRSITGQVMELFRDRAERKRITLSAAIEPTDLKIVADRKGLEHVMTNLVDNAVKYCGSGDSVQIRAHQNGQGVEIEVQDDGPGIAGQHLPRLFERFYRVDTGRSRELGGTGLGLSIVRHLVDAMDGTVTVDSAPGKGTRFCVHLPVREA